MAVILSQNLLLDQYREKLVSADEGHEVGVEGSLGDGRGSAYGLDARLLVAFAHEEPERLALEPAPRL